MAGSPGTVRFGIHVGHLGGPLDELRKLWRFADSNGFDWFSVSDHFQESPPKDGNGNCYEAVAILGAAATETERIRLGCLVFCAGYRNPGLLAKSVTALDNLSGGRMECGLGAGWLENDFVAYGIPFLPLGQRQDQLEECARVVRSLLRSQRVDFEGKHYTMRNAPNYPRPIQSELPIWIGGGGEKRTLRTAAQYSDVWNAAYLSPSQWVAKNQVLDTWCESFGRDGGEISRTANIGFYMGADEAGVARQEGRWRDDWGNDKRGFTGFLRGSPTEAIDVIGTYADAGVQQINIAVREGPYEWAALETFVADVAPAFR